MSWSTKTFNVTIELTQDILGTIPKTKSIFANHLAAKMERKGKKEGLTSEEIQKRIADDLAQYDEDEKDVQAGFTTFFEDDDGPYLKDYQMKGFLKESARTLKQFGAMKQLRDKVSRYLFIEPVKIRLPKQEEYNVNERPLRGETARGPRVSIARSDTIPAGTQISFDLVSLNGVVGLNCIEAILDYGKYQGIGQWRSGGWGRFIVKNLTEAK